MARLLTFCLLIILLVYLIKCKFFQGNQQKSNDESIPKKNLGEAMVKCSQCGIYLPISEALTINQNYYCCDSHLPPK